MQSLLYNFFQEAPRDTWDSPQEQPRIHCQKHPGKFQKGIPQVAHLLVYVFKQRTLTHHANCLAGWQAGWLADKIRATEYKR